MTLIADFVTAPAAPLSENSGIPVRGRLRPDLSGANTLDTQTLPTDFEALLAAVESIARDVTARHAADVDTRGRFPTETIEALKRVRALSAPVPREYGGLGLGMTEMGRLCAVIAAACGSSGMVLAMHYIQVGCIARHHGGVPELQDYLREIVATQPVLASMTSEVRPSAVAAAA